MKKILWILAFTALLTLALSPAALAAETKRPKPKDLKYPALTVKTPPVTEIGLDCGLQGFLVEDHEIPVVDVVLLVKTYFPEQGKYGLNEMAQWVIRNGGTAQWPGDKLNDELEYLAASVEVYGGDLSTQIAFNCLKKDLPKVLAIFADLVRNPAFPEDKVEMKRKTMLEAIRRQNDEPNSVAYREFQKKVWSSHPYGWVETTASVNAIQRADLTAFHQQYFHPNNAILGVSGDVTKDEIVAALNQALGDWPKADVSIPKVPDVPAMLPDNYNYAFRDINQAYMLIGHLGINANNPDRPAVNVMNYILGGGSFTSWITEKVRSDEGLAYSTGSRYGADAFAAGNFTAFAQTKAEAYSRALQLIVDQIKRMQDPGPTEEEVKKAVDSYLNSQVFDYESKAQVVRRMVQLRFEGRPLDTPEKDMEAYRKLTAAEIKRVARIYLHPDMLTILVVGNEKLFDRPLSDFGKVNVIQLDEEK
jgi:zinc protease